MSLARAWRRQLYGASSAALIVPSAMLAALMVLALSGGLESVGVLGQIFAGPRVPVTSGALPGAHGGAGRRATGAAIPVIPVTVAAVPSQRAVAGTPGRRGVPVSAGGSRRSGGAIAPVGGTAPIVSGRPGTPTTPSPARPTPGQASGQPNQPSPPSPPPRKPTPVDTVVTVVTSVTEQVPAPAGPAVTQAVQSVSTAAGGLLPPSQGAIQ